MLNRTKAPSFSQDFSFELPQPEIIPLRNDSRIIWLNGIQQDVFKIELIFDTNKWNEPIKGLCHFLALMLDKGTRTQTASQISTLLDYYGAQLEIHPGLDFTSVSLYGLKKSFKEVFPLVISLLTESSFPEGELQLQKDIFTQNLRVNNKKSSFLASKLLRQNLFGKSHPYGSSIEEQDLTNISSDKLVGFFQNSFGLKDVFLVGNFAQEDLKWLQSQVGSILQKKAKDVFSDVIHQSADIRVDELKGVQATVRLGKRFINRNHTDYPGCLIINHILGGFFGSRLMKNIREEKGLTYGISSSIQPLKRDSFFTIGTDVNVKKIDLALAEIKNEIERLLTELISIEELTIAKNHFMGSLQLEVSNPFTSIEKIKTIYLNDLNLGFYKNLFYVIKELNSSELKEVSSKYFGATSFNVVVVF